MQGAWHHGMSTEVNGDSAVRWCIVAWMWFMMACTTAVEPCLSYVLLQSVVLSNRLLQLGLQLLDCQLGLSQQPVPLFQFSMRFLQLCLLLLYQSLELAG